MPFSSHSGGERVWFQFTQPNRPGHSRGPLGEQTTDSDQNPFAERARLLQKNRRPPRRSPAPWAIQPPRQTETHSPRGLGSYNNTGNDPRNSLRRR